MFIGANYVVIVKDEAEDGVTLVYQYAMHYTAVHKFNELSALYPAGTVALVKIVETN